MIRKHVLLMVLVAGVLMLLAIGIAKAAEGCEALARSNEALAKFRDRTKTSVVYAISHLQDTYEVLEPASSEQVMWTHLLTMAIWVHREVSPDQIYRQTLVFCNRTGWG